MNYVVLLGRLASSPEWRFSEGGKEWCSFSFVVTDYKKKATFLRCLSTQRVNSALKYLKKGDFCRLSGTIQVRSQERNGISFSSYTILITEVEFCPKSLSQNSDPSGSVPAEKKEESEPPVNSDSDYYLHDDFEDVPF